jgi:type IX secretion system PorP/SprF family membrane protein
MNTDYLEQKQVRHYALHGGYRFDINDDYSIEPSLVFRMIEEGQMTLDFNVKASIMNIAWVGVSYRLNDAVAPMFGIDMDKFMFGYAYDITMSDISNYSQGSHELMFIYKIGSTKTATSL